MTAHYPIVGCIATNDPESHTPEGQKRTARYDYAAHSKDPGVIAGVHAANPSIVIAFEWMPQFIPGTNRYGQYPWNLKNFIADQAEKNGWVLKQKGSNEPVKTWGWRWLNFTSQCPVADDGTTLVEFMVGAFDHYHVTGGVQGWGHWGEANQYDATLFDVIFDTIWDGWLGRQIPEYDGTEEEFRDDWSKTTHEFITLLRERIPRTYQLQAGGDSHMPAPSLVENWLDGIKQEDALVRFTEWPHEYDGRDKPNRQRGLLWARSQFRNDERFTLFQTRVDTESQSQEEVDRWVRYTLGTAMLTDAIYICINSEETGGGLITSEPQPYWHKLFEQDFGTFGGVVHEFANGVFIRDFWEDEDTSRILPAIGRIVLNTSDQEQGGVPARDCLFQLQGRDWVRVFVDIFGHKHNNEPLVDEMVWIEQGIRTCDVEAIEALCRRELNL